MVERKVTRAKRLQLVDPEEGVQVIEASTVWSRGR